MTSSTRAPKRRTSAYANLKNGSDPVRHAAHLRGLNLDRVLAVAIDRTDTFTRAEISDATGLSAPTVGSLSSELIQSGVLTDLGTGPSRGGRRPSFMEFNARYGFVAGIDLGPTHTRLAVADLRGQVVAHQVLRTPRTRGPKAILERLAEQLQTLMRQSGVPPDRLLAVGAGAPGVVDCESGHLIALAPNLRGWSDVPMGTILGKALGAPVIVENDVNLAILGERWRGAARGHNTCAFIWIGTGIGSGIIVQGELHRGHHFQAGEIALMCMGPQFVETDFGARGCFETLAGLNALASAWAKNGSRRTDHDGWVRELFADAAAGEPTAAAAVRNTATLLGIATANLTVVIDPSLVILGGALIAQAPSLVDEVKKIVARIVPEPSEIVASPLGQEAPLWGTLRIAMNEARERLRQQITGLTGLRNLRPTSVHTL
jgi:predicted NBD/HSP70 family sugar kinase